MADKSLDVKVLQDTVHVMDAIGQEAFGQICALSDLALKLMETEHAYKTPEALAQVFLAIRSKAADANELIGTQAEGVGCEYSDKSEERRRNAKDAAGGLHSRAELLHRAEH